MFEYESNKYGANIVGPGLRIKKQTMFDPVGNKTVIKSYKYGISESGNGVLRLVPSVENSTSKAIDHGQYIGEGFAYRKRTYYSDFLPAINDFISANIIYPTVTEYIGDATTNTGKTVYLYEPTLTTPLYISPVQPQTFSLPGVGMTGLSFTDNDNVVAPMKISPNFYYQNELTGKTVYKNVGGIYSKVKEVGFNFNNYNTSVLKEVVLHKYINVVGITSPSDLTIYDTYLQAGVPVFLNDEQSLFLGARKMISQTETDFNDNGNVVNTTTYQYSNLEHLFPSSITIQKSDGATFITKNKYPKDFTNISATDNVSKGVKLLQDRNIQNRIIESSSYTITGNNPELMTSTLFNAAKPLVPYSDKILKIENRQPVSDFTQASVQSGAISYDARYTDQIIFDSYDSKGNILQQHKNNDINHSYIWDYLLIHPIAEVTNATQSNIAYTSFEADGKGNWAYTGVPTTDATKPPTGKRYFTIVNNTNNITKNGLSTTTTYIVSYWKKSGTIGVNSTTPITGKTVGDWTYFEHKVVNPSGGLITVSGTNGVIDELRLYPSSAQMTTYTYDPLIGTTSQCDVNNNIIYYEYDGFRRLIVIKDQDKNTIKKICYNYAGQPEGCLSYRNAFKSGTYTRACTDCGTGSTITYTVPEGKYTAASQVEADALAQNDVNTNGQAFANANGTCSAPANVYAAVNNTSFSTATISFTNNCSHVTYTYNIDLQSSATFGPFPAGTYRVDMNAQGSHTYYINGYSQSSSVPVNFNNIPISGTATVEIN
jgi:hypothetical protein